MNAFGGAKTERYITCQPQKERKVLILTFVELLIYLDTWDSIVHVHALVI